MLLEEEELEMRWSSVNKKRYTDAGYKFTTMGDSFYPKVKDIVLNSKGVKVPVKCDYCGQVYYPTANNYLKVFRRKEKDCCVSCKGSKIKSTVQKKYGVNNVMQVEEVNKKHRVTCLERFGTETPLQNRDIFNKTKNSLNKHYNIQNGIGDIRKVDEIESKIQNTNKERYNGISPFCSDEVKKKVRNSLWGNGTCRTSKKQIQLAEMLKDLYGNCVLNYPCDKVSLDCLIVINDIKIDVEYDGWYYHKDRKAEDLRRDFFVEKQGYKVLRLKAVADRLPTKEELTNAIQLLLTTDRKFKRIELNKCQMVV